MELNKVNTLRPVTNPKVGDVLIGVGDDVEYTVVAGPDSSGEYCLSAAGRDGPIFNLASGFDYLRHMPLFWLEGTAIYKGDPVYYDGKRYPVSAVEADPRFVRLHVSDNCFRSGIPKAALSLNEPKIVLELSQMEARSVCAILGRVGGGGDTPRRYTEEVYFRLKDMGVKGLWDIRDVGDYLEAEGAAIEFTAKASELMTKEQ